MNGLYFYKLVSPYSEDVTKNCKLTVNEIDNNFVTLKDAEISGASYDKVSQALTLTRNNGEEISIDLSSTLSGITTNLEVEYDSIDGVITITNNGSKTTITGLLTTDNLSNEILTEVISDGTLNGLGAKKSPLGLSPVEKSGTFKPVLKFVDVYNGEVLPTVSHRVKGDRYLIRDRINDYGYLYNFSTVKKIDSDLTNGWRVPTKEDWDGVLNAIEPCDEYRNHTSMLANNMLGKYAGKILKSNDKWLLVDDCDEEYINSVEEILETDEFDVELSEVKTTPTKKVVNPIGTDNYRMGLLPSGEYDDDEEVRHFLKRGLYWTSTQCNASDVYVKRFDYNKTGVIQTVESPANYFSLRLVKDYDGSNHHDVEYINGMNYPTVLLPSETAKLGYSVWTSIDVAFAKETYSYKEPNMGEDIGSKDVYFILDWDGKDWVRKQMEEGESVVIVNSFDGRKGISYRIVDGQLFCESDLIRNEIVESLQPNIGGVVQESVNEIFRNVEENNNAMHAALDSEVIRATESEEALKQRIEELEARVAALEGMINGSSEEEGGIGINKVDYLMNAVQFYDASDEDEGVFEIIPPYSDESSEESMQGKTGLRFRIDTTDLDYDQEGF